MKKIILVVVCLLAVLTSCQDEEVYSCDKKVNEWIHANLAEIRLMNRSEWKQLDENVKGPVFGAFTPFQKYSFWKEKLNEVLNLAWAEDERNHLMALNDFVKNNESFFNVDRVETDAEVEKNMCFCINGNSMRWKN